MPRNDPLSIVVDDLENEKNQNSELKSVSNLQSPYKSVELTENSSKEKSFSNNNTDVTKPTEKIILEDTLENDDITQTPKQRRTPKKDEHLESIKKKLSQHSLYVKELKEGIRNRINKSKQMTNNLNHQIKENKGIYILL